jgi:membrane protease YdiL (CAAX protease family)
MSKSLKVSLITVLAFGVYFFIDELFFRELRKSIFNGIGQLGVSHIISYTIVGIPIFTGVLILHGRRNFFKSLGLRSSLIKGFLFALLCTLPMFVGFAFVFEFNHDISLNTFLISIVAAAFFEELYFRSFLFGQLFRYTRLGFIPSVILGALLFGAVHLYQSTDPGELIGIFLVTFLGGLLFAWVYTEWKYNLWIAVFLHLLMNLSWELFSVSDNAFGSLYANIFRLITIAMIIVFTLVYKKRRGEKLMINKQTIWKKPVTD